MKKSFIVLAAAVMALVGCNKQQTVAPIGQPGDVLFTSNIQTYTLKATDIAFENGDKVGIFAGTPINKNNVLATVSGTSLNHNSAIKWVDGDNGIVKFYAYYPYVENATLNLPFAVQENQGNGGYAKSDLMLASAQSAQTENAVALNFRHALSKVSIGITNNFTDATVTKVVMEDVARDVLVNLETGELTPSDAVPGNITANTIPGGYELILVPQVASPKIRVSLSNNKDYVFEITSAFTFQAGKKASASLVLDPQAEANAVLFSLSVADWGADENPLEFDDPTIEDGEPVWEVIGTLNGKTWEDPTIINMVKDEWGNWNADITYVAGEEFKLRCENVWAGINAEWNTEIYGLGDFGNDSNYLSTDPNSKNIKLLESGDYHLFFVSSNNWFVVTKNGGDDPQPAAEEWNIVGSFNNWADGVTVMTAVANNENAVEAQFTYASTDSGFKFKATGDWSEVKFYGPASGQDTEIDLTAEYTQLVEHANGNLSIAPGTYKATLVIKGENAGKLYIQAVE